MIKFNQYITESEKALKNKAEKSGMPLGILRKVYNRGFFSSNSSSSAFSASR